MRRTLRVWRPAALVAAIAATLSACGAAGTPDIRVSDVRMPEPAGPNGATYMTLVNEGDRDDRLVSVESDVTGSVEIHESTLDGGVMSMQQVDAVDVPAGGEVRLEPGGLHLMLLDVDQDLAVGQQVTFTLTFDRAGRRTVTAEVVPLVGGDTASER